MTTQAISFIVPVITLPLLIRRLGLSDYGNYTLVLLLWQSMTILMDYSFNTVGVQLFSKSSNKYKAFNEIFAARLIITSFCLMLLPILSFFFLKSFHAWFIVGGAVFIFGYFLTNNQWYYANEQFKLLAVINLISRVVLIILVISFSFDEISGLYAQCAAILMGGIISLLFSKYYKYIRVSDISLRFGIKFIYSSRRSFGANFVGYLLSNSPLLLGSFILSPISYGTYALADRIIRVFLALYGGAGQVIFRRAINRVAESHSALDSFIRTALARVIPFYISFICLGISLIYFFQPLVFHSRNKVNFAILIFLAIWSVISVFNGIIGYTYLQAIEKYQIYFNMMLVALVLTVLLIYFFGRFESGLGIVAVLIFVELIIGSVCFHLFASGRFK